MRKQPCCQPEPRLLTPTQQRRRGWQSLCQSHSEIEIQRILCPIDFSDFSRRAFDHALAIAQWYDSTIRLLHVSGIREVLRVAGEQRADLLVAGVHGRGAIDRLLFGSTAQRLVRQASCPVLTLRKA